MSFFGKKEFVLIGAAFNAIQGLKDSDGSIRTAALREVVRKSESDLYDPMYARSRSEYGSEMKIYARQLREVLDWLEANPGKGFAMRTTISR